MPSREITVRHLIAGGWSPDFGDVAEVRVVSSGSDFMVVEIPFLTEVRDMFFATPHPGGVHKAGGVDRINSAALESGADVLGLYDYWKMGTAGNPNQMRLAAVGTKVKKDDADGSFSDVITGLQSGAVPWFTQFDDIAIFSNDSGTDQPWQYDQSSAQRLQASVTTAFTGGGLDDGTGGGTFTGDTDSTFDVEIDATGSPDTFKWRKDGGAYTTGVSITGAAQTLSDGVTITFAATTGHTLSDVWTLTTHLAPRFSFAVPHKNRLWAAGDDTNPDTLYYSISEDPRDFDGSGSGTISISPGDGDRIVGLASHRGQLIVFKGPYKGSIHRVTGSAPSEFALEPIITGIGGVWQNSIFAFGDDLGFVANDATVRSLRATERFGDYDQASLSFPLNEWLKEHVNKSRLRNIWARATSLGRVFIGISVDGSTTHNETLCMDHRFDPPFWSRLPSYEAESAAIVVDASSSNRPTLFLGSEDGFVLRAERSDRNIEGASNIQGEAHTPFLAYGNPQMLKTLTRASVGLAPKGNFDVTFGWRRDRHPLQSQTKQQGGGDVLGPTSINPFVLDTSELGAEGFLDLFFSLEEGGLFRSVQYQISNERINEDLEVRNFSATFKPSGMSAEN